jgi:LCP family protein required for cell wall assembly
MASYLPTPKSKLPKQPKPEKADEQPAVSQEAPPPAAVRPARKGPPEWAQGMLTTLAIAGLAVAAFFSFSVSNTFFSKGMIVLPGISSAPEKTALPPGVTPTAEIPMPTPKPWNGVDRITILAMGLDSRDWEAQPNKNVARSDTMIVMTMDPIAKTAAMLSIPRDLYVDIPGYGFDKINRAYFLAEKDRRPGGGPALAMKTVEQLIGVPIDHYAVVDFNSFTTFVNTIDGIDVYIPFDNMIIDPVGDEEVKQLHFGWNHLTGSEALAFARTRSTEEGDVDRASRTQQVILAIRNKILNLNMIPTLLAKAPDLFNQISGGIKTDLTETQIVQLAWAAKDIDFQNIRSDVIDKSCWQAIETINSEDYLIPNLEAIREKRASLFSSDGIPGYATPPGDPTQLAFRENAEIEIVNGTYTSGFAGATRDYLVRQGFSEANITVRDAREDELLSYPLTTLVTDYTGRPFTMRLLYELMGLKPVNIKTDIRFDSAVDVQIFLKYDWAVPEG